LVWHRNWFKRVGAARCCTWRQPCAPVTGAGTSPALSANSDYVLGFYLLLLTVWQGWFSAQVLPDYLFPSPWQVVRRLWELGGDNCLWPMLLTVMFRVLLDQFVFGLIQKRILVRWGLAQKA